VDQRLRGDERQGDFRKDERVSRGSGADRGLQLVDLRPGHGVREPAGLHDFERRDQRHRLRDERRPSDLHLRPERAELDDNRTERHRGVDEREHERNGDGERYCMV